MEPHCAPFGLNADPIEARGRDVINAVVWFVKTGVRSRDLPERFGNSTAVYSRLPLLGEPRTLGRNIHGPLARCG
ncbi:transposase [Corallococcus exiguus]|uniref:transposase n=1 Tax=Corallococcus exiguus TaxID=83462 RepID=UPI001A8E5A5C|nr:transposase [Corallococcus exiguus]